MLECGFAGCFDEAVVELSLVDVPFPGKPVTLCPEHLVKALSTVR